MHTIEYLFRPGRLLHKLKAVGGFTSDRFLRKLSGVIHVGANTGQERTLYDQYRLSVVWIEPIPDIFLELQTNLSSYPKQRAYQYLLTDVDGQDYAFNIANNQGASSSIFEMELHKDVWSDISYTKTIKLSSVTLPSFMVSQNIDIHKFDGLVLDTQGSELLILKGAEGLLHNFKFIKTEAPDFESYRGGCHLRDLEDFLDKHGFQEFSRSVFAQHPSEGKYYDIVYKRRI